MDVNLADVTYKVVYRKNNVRASESNAIKMGGDYDTDHEAAYKAAWGLDVSIERYVNGRKVNRASASEASFNTYVQLGKRDVDMMDYQLYEIEEDDDTGIAVSLVPMDYEPEETGGLFTFTATEGSRYVMVYNRAYRLYFLNNTAPDIYRYWFAKKNPLLIPIMRPSMRGLRNSSTISSARQGQSTATWAGATARTVTGSLNRTAA